MKDVSTRGIATRRRGTDMIIVDENRLADQTIEMIGHDMGIDDVGLTFEGYVEKVKKILRKAPLSVIKGLSAIVSPFSNAFIYIFTLSVIILSEYVGSLAINFLTNSKNSSFI